MTLPRLEAPDDGELRIIVFGPGYGESLIFGTAASGWMVIDSLAADDDDGLTVNPALTLLEDAGEDWSLLMMTHPHEDHSAGMAELISRPSSGVLACVQRFVPVPDQWDLRNDTGEDPGETEVLGAKERALIAMRTHWDSRDESQRWDPRAGDTRRFGDADLTCLWPTQTAVDQFDDDDDPNTLSCALAVECQGHRLLLGADVLTAQWAEIASGRGRDALTDNGFVKVAHHGSKGAIIKALAGEQGSSTWVLTPWDHGRKLPQFGEKEGIHKLHGQHSRLHLTAFPFRAPPRDDEAGYWLTREGALELRQAAALTDQRTHGRQLPRPVRGGWLDVVMEPDGEIRWKSGSAGRGVRAA